MDAALIIGYLGMLSIVLIAPFLAKREAPAGQNRSPSISVTVLVGLACATFTFVGRGGFIFPLALLLLIPFARRGAWTLAGGAVATCLFAPAIWWNPNLVALSLWQWVAFASLSGVMIIAVFASLRSLTSDIDPAPAPRLEYYAAFGIAVLIALGVGLYSAPFTHHIPAHTAWHHWGAYLSPVDALLAGGLPFHDFPIQYGIGPTLLIASVCGSDCWSAMFNVVLIANALYCGALVTCALIITAKHNRTLRAISVVAVGCAALLWTGFPSDFGTALATPSVAGLRFLPLVCQLLFILWAERNPWVPLVLGHAIWVFSLFWSMEAAAFASLLWWPWLALHAARRHPERSQHLIMLRYAVISIAAFSVAMIVLLGIFQLSFGTLPELPTVMAYFENPPGREPANPLGPVWLAVLAAIMSLGVILRGKIEENGSVFACVISMLVVFSYYLSRSHDNNILNLFPFILLVTFCIIPQPGRQLETDDAFRMGFSLTFIMSVIAFTTTFNFSVWEKIASGDQLAHIGPAPLIQQVSVDGTEPDPIVSPDAIALFNEVRKQSKYAPLLFDEKAVMPWAPATRSWTGVNNIANYSPLPATLVRRYINRGARRYQRAGWMVVEQRQFAKWALLFTDAYEIRALKQRGRYTAYLMVPKSLPAIP